MSLANRSLVTIDSISNGEIEALFSLADEMGRFHESAVWTMPGEDYG